MTPFIEWKQYSVHRLNFCELWGEKKQNQQMSGDLVMPTGKTSWNGIDVKSNFVANILYIISFVGEMTDTCLWILFNGQAETGSSRNWGQAETSQTTCC